MNARIIRRYTWIAPLIGLMYMAAGCAHVDRHPSDTGLLNGFDAKEARLMLDERVSEIVNAANEMHERDETILRTTEPYHYRVSEYYPQGPDPDKYRVSLRRLPGNRTKFEATVAIPFQRTMTRYHQSRAAADRDDTFIREEGALYAVFSLSGRAWRMQYSYFEPAVVKTFDGAKWVEEPFVADRFVDDKPSILRRMFGWMI